MRKRSHYALLLQRGLLVWVGNVVVYVAVAGLDMDCGGFGHREKAVEYVAAVVLLRRYVADRCRAV